MKNAFCICLLFLSLNIFAQHEEGTFLLLKGGVHQGWRTMGELSAGRIKYGHKSLGGHYEYAGSEFNFNPKNLILGPKAGFDVWALFVVAGANLTYYTDLQKGTLYFNPHVGSLIYFGWNIPLMRNHMKGRVNTFTFTLTIPLGLGNRLK